LQRGDPVAALERVDEALRLLGDRVGDDVWVSQWPNVSCPAHFVLDDTDAVRRDVGAGRAVSAKLTVLDSVRMPGYLAWAAAVDGELEEATRQARLALDAADALGMAQSNFGRVTPVLSLAVVAAEHDDLDEAARLTGQALEAAEWARRRTFLLFCVLQQAQLDRTLGEVPSALARLEQARRVLPDASPEVTDHIDRLDAAIAIEAGNPKAPALVEGLRPSPFRALLEARLLLRQGDARSAAALLDEHRGAMHNRRLHVEHGLLEARALAPRNRERALDTLAGVLRRAAPVGLLRTVIDAGADVHSLIEALPTDPQTAAFAAEVLAAVHRRPTVRRSAERDAVDTLSEREHDVLRFLASRLSYSEIAGELYISVNTLKSHVKAVYRKLGVSTRAEAVEAARRSGLL
jgi:LuxR family maltose regulon positive regulatory protein